VTLALAVILLIGAVIGSQLRSLVENAPQYQSTISQKYESLHQTVTDLAKQATGRMGAAYQPPKPPPGASGEAAPDESPIQYVRRLAEQKAFAVPMNAGEIVLAGDTVVVVDQHILEKPSDEADALRMLRLLSGRDHEVITGICLRSGTQKIVDSVTTRVHFVELSEAERGQLATLLSGGKHAARKIKRAQILLAADAGEAEFASRC